MAGLVATFVEAPQQLQQRVKFPEDMLKQCQMQNIPVTGNAANHTDSNGGWLDLSGEPHAPPPIPAGFTAKGYVAMTGCVIAAIVGLITIVWYGLTDPFGDVPSGQGQLYADNIPTPGGREEMDGVVESSVGSTNH